MINKKNPITILTESDFSKFVNDKKNPLIIVDFFADWCGPCQMMAPIIERIAEKFPKVKFAKINVDDAQEVSTKYEISSIPCFIFFKDGEEVDRIAQSMSQDIFEEKVRDYLKN